MIKFITKLFGYLFLLALILELACSVLINNVEFSYKLGLKPKFLGQQSILNKSKQCFESDTLHIGDSVARQIFQGKNNTFTSHAGILMEGNYILLKNILRHNPQVKVVLFGVTPTSLSFGFNESVTSLNYIKPYQSIYKYKDLDLHSIKHMLTKPLSLLYLFNFGKYLPMDDVNFLLEQPYRKNLSDHSFKYLNKMMDLCQSKKIQFVMYCPPITQRRVDVTNDFQEIKGRVFKTRLEAFFNRYFRTIQVLEDDYFRDGHHFKNPIIREERKAVQNKILKKIKESKGGQ